MRRVAPAAALALAVAAGCSLFGSDAPGDACTRDTDCFRAQGEMCIEGVCQVPGPVIDATPLPDVKPPPDARPPADADLTAADADLTAADADLTAADAAPTDGGA